MRFLEKLFTFRRRQRLLLLSCQIHGSHYYECSNLLEQSALYAGDRLILKREPSNEYDGFAIEVFAPSGQKLGYIPKHINQVIANLMDQRCGVTASIDNIITTAWEPVTISVYCNRK